MLYSFNMSKNIVIVDDEAKITTMLELYVKSKGHNAYCFADGDQALNFIKNNPTISVNLLVTDFEMPTLKGIDLIKHLNAGGFSFPKILLTSHGNKNVLVESVNNHIFKFIEKPFNWEQFNEPYQAALALDQDNSKTEDLKKLGETYSNIVHEINNPLNLILLFTDLIKTNCENNIEMDSAQLLSQLDNIQNSGQRINHIIQDIKEFLNSKPCQIKEFNLESVLEEVERGFKAVKNSNHIKLRFDTPLGLTMKMDSGQLYRLLINLVSNSADAISDLPEKWIKIISNKTFEFTLIRVVDSGKGIPEEVVPKLFDKNYSNKKSTKGTGLGLDICKKILMSYNGDIYYELYEGNTSFVIKIPN